MASVNGKSEWVRMPLAWRRSSALLLLSLALMLPRLAVAEADLVDERHRLEFLLAIKALEAGDYEKFRQLAEHNQDYLLYPYLRFYDIRTRLSTVSDTEVADFIKNYSETPLGGQLQHLWMEELAKQKRWPQFVEFYSTTSNPRIRCLYLKARYDLASTEKEKSRFLIQAKKLWMSPSDQPDDCRSLFDLLQQNKLLDRELYLDRIGLAISDNQMSLVDTLARQLDSDDRQRVNDWKLLRNDTTKLLTLPALQADDARNRSAVLEAMQRFARSDAEKASGFWEQVKPRYAFSKDDVGKIKRYFALRAAYQLNPEAYTWLKAVPAQWVNDDVRVWRIRAALRQLNWSAVLADLQGLSEEQKKEEEWQYWLARANQERGNKKLAKSGFKTVAKLTSYYGFMASDRLKARYTFADDPLNSDPRRFALLESLPGIQRSRELYLLDRLTDARREWNYAVRQFDEPKIKLAAVLAHQWQWHHVAITTIAMTSHRADYALRFATPFQDVVETNAESFAIDKVWIYGIIRRESAFKLDARSEVGASGLMQLMPATARQQAKKIGIDPPDANYLLTPEGNIRLGSSYLSDMLRRFDGVQALATAAYNAGPRRVDKWIPETKSMPMDAWIDSLPYTETREYVKAVMAYTTIFEWRLKESVTRLSERMGEQVPAK